MFNNKIVVRAGWGMYYDRGELFTYLSPGFAAGVIAGGPFGVSTVSSVRERNAVQHLTRYSSCTFRKPLWHYAAP